MSESLSRELSDAKGHRSMPRSRNENPEFPKQDLAFVRFRQDSFRGGVQLAVVGFVNRSSAIS